ncbi:MAG TPA: DHA2 family efflux MFS transporter permease subunit [Chlamydiales bacterium]|nr:DHA2 family efflux MFS transporter permease subunit [Chlamydiales bacterium]
MALLTLSLSLGTFMMVLDYSIANVSIPYIAGDLGVSDTNGTWVITCFAAGNAIGLPLTGFISDRFGSVRTFVASIILFTLFSWFCAAAFNFPMLLISRFFQGFFAGPLIPLSQSLLLVFYPPAKRKLALAIWSAVVVVGPILGPILGGYLTYNYVWRWIFYINIPFGVIAAWITWQLARMNDTEPVKRNIDFIGLSLLAIGVTCLQVMVDNGQQYDWFRSDMIWTLMIGSFIGFIFLIIWQLTSHDPLIDLTLFKNRNFAVGTFVTAVAYMLFFGNMVVLPLWLQEFMGYTAQWAGFALAWMGFLPLALMPLLVKLMQKYSLRPIVGLCMTLFFATFMSFSFFTPQVGFEFVALSRFCLGLPIAFYMAPLATLTLARLPPEKLAMGSGIFHFVRIFFGGVGTSLITTLWERRTIFHHFNLASTQTPFNPMTQSVLHLLDQVHLTGKRGLDALNMLVDQQAALLALNDVFWVSAWCFVPLIGLTFLFKRRPQFDPDKAH